MELVLFEIGKRFPNEKVLEKLDVGKGHSGGASLDYIKEEKTLCMYVVLPNPTKKEIQHFRKDLIRFALYHNHMLDTSIIMTYFGTQLLVDLLYDINVVDLDMDGLVEGNRFDIFLIDSNTGILHGMRTLGLGEKFMSEINRITRNDCRYTSAEYQQWLVGDVMKKPLETLWRESERIDWDK